MSAGGLDIFILLKTMLDSVIVERLLPAVPLLPLFPRMTLFVLFFSFERAYFSSSLTIPQVNVMVKG